MALDMYLGETLVFDVTFDYRGPRLRDRYLHCAIGVRSLLGIFDETHMAEISLDLPETSDWVRIWRTLALVLDPAEGLRVMDGWDLEVKVYKDLLHIDLFWKMDRAINIKEKPIEFSNLSVVITKG